MNNEKKPCPFCGGTPVECWSNKWHAWAPGEARACIACGSCGSKSKEHYKYCGTRNGTQEDVAEVLAMAWESWNRRTNAQTHVSPCDDEMIDYYDPSEDCPRCKGSGQVPTESYESYFGDNYKTCPDCGGNG